MLINRITLLGHKDHGKSTLIGSMLMVTGAASEQRINEAKATSKSLGRQFEPGYILDSFEEERQGEMTIDTTRAQVKYKDTAFEFIDVPGHEELIKNMISGASYAKFALLLVSAKDEEGIKPQTKRHIFLSKMMGIDKIIVAVNKMDTIGYDQRVFNEIKAELSKFLEKVGIKKDSIYFIPVSAYNAENLKTNSNKMKWYKGKPLLELMRVMVNSRETSRNNELRVLIQGSIPHEKGEMLIGNILSGSLKSGQGIKIMPDNINASIKALFVKGLKKQSANYGENIALQLNKPATKELRGHVIYSAADAHNPVSKINATIFLTKQIGKKVTVRFNGSQIPGSMKINHVIDTTTGIKETAGKKNHTLNAADVTITLESKISAEPYENSKELGRFIVYEGSEFAGIGIIK